MNCPNCGIPQTGSDVCCPNCGYPVGPQPAPDTSGSLYPNRSVLSTLPEKKRPNKKKKILIIAAVVTVLAIIAGILSWVFIFSKELVYVLTAAHYYSADGTHYGYTKYEYDDRANILRHEYCNNTASERVWNDQTRAYEYVTVYEEAVDPTIVQREYNDKGYIIRESKDYPEGYDYSYETTEYSYDFNGDLIIYLEIVNTVTTDGKDTTNTTAYYLEYDSSDRLTEAKVQENNGTKELYLQIDYDSDGRIQEEQIGNYRYTYRYDGDRVTEAKTYYLDGTEGWELQETSTFGYDKNGRITSSSQERSDYDSTSHIEMTYDDSGNLTLKKYVWEGDYATATREYRYSYSGNISGHYSYSYSYSSEYYSSSEEERAELEYDKNGCLIKETYSDGSYSEYEYQQLRLSPEDAARYYRQTYPSDVPVFYMYLVDWTPHPEYGTTTRYRGSAGTNK